MPLERIPEMLERLRNNEETQKELKRLLFSSVDDVKNLIKSEIMELKTEQISDLKMAIKNRDHRFEKIEERLYKIELILQEWKSGATILNWGIRLILAVAGAVAGYFGAKHLGI